MKNRKRKGFTIVELVIVIAIVAVLAGVLIPTFASIIDKANQSADIQAARQLNDALVIGSVENKPDDIEDVIHILAAAGYDSEKSLKPITTGYRFFWFAEENTIVLAQIPDFVDKALALDISTDGESDYEVKVVYPEGRDVEGSVAHKFETILKKLVEILVAADYDKETFPWNTATAEGLVALINEKADSADLFNSLSGLISSNLWSPKDPLGEDTSDSKLVTSVQFSENHLSLTTGDIERLTPTIEPSDATNKTLKWVSSNTDVATVYYGYVTALSAGEATITATAKDGSGVYATCTVTVTGGESGDVTDPNTPEGTPLVIGTPSDDGAYHLTAGTYYLEANTDINVPVVTEGEVTIDLNGHTLTLGTGEAGQNWTSSPITVSGTLTITGSGNSEVVIATYDFSNAGIHVQSGGTLNLTDIAVNDYLAMKGIENEGDANFTNVNFTVDNGRGLFSTGDVVISGCEFSSGEDAPNHLIYSDGGTMEIYETTFSGTCSTSAIQLNTTGTVYLEKVSMTTTSANVSAKSYTPVEISGGSFAGTISGQFAISDGTFADVFLYGKSSISGGTFSGLLTFGQNGETTITDGSFTGGLKCEIAKVTIDGGEFSGLLYFYDHSDVIINGGTFNSQLKCESTANGTFSLTIYDVNDPKFSDGTTTSASVSYTNISDAILHSESKNCELKSGDGCWTVVHK